MKFLLLMNLIAMIAIIDANACDNLPEGSMVERKCIQLESCIDMVIEDSQNNDDIYEIDYSEAKEFCTNRRDAFNHSLKTNERFPVGQTRK